MATHKKNVALGSGRLAHLAKRLDFSFFLH